MGGEEAKRAVGLFLVFYKNYIYILITFLNDLVIIMYNAVAISEGHMYLKSTHELFSHWLKLFKDNFDMD